MTRTVLRGAYALLGSGFDFERRPLDVLVDGERISAIEPANSIHDAGAVIDLTRHLLVPGFINGHMRSEERRVGKEWRSRWRAGEGKNNEECRERGSGDVG